MDDLLAENEDHPTAELVSSIHARKTAALLASSLEMGILLGSRGDDSDAIIQTRRMGLAIGHAFQAVDDLLDATAQTADLGKSADQDAARGKSTLVSSHGIEQARSIASQRTGEALDACRELGGNNTFLLAMIEWLGSRDH